MITIEQLNISYPTHKKLINQLNISLKKGQIHGLVGLNGSGKTTLLKCIFGLKKADSGRILWDKNQALNKKQMAYLATENFFYSNITGYEYLKLFKQDKFELKEWNKLFDLDLDELIDNYSTGMKKKLALLGVLKQDKDLIILDEPFNGLDIESSRILRMLLLKLKEKGKTIIISSHILETLRDLCDFIHYLENGKITFSKDKEEQADFEKQLFEKIEDNKRSSIEQLIR